MVSIEDISISLGFQKPELRVSNVNLTTGLWGLVGRNGAGKSTFLNALSGVNQNFKGSIVLSEKTQTEYSSLELAKKIAVVFSKSEIFGNHTAKDVLYLGRIPFQGVFSKLSKEDHQKVNEVVSLLNLQLLLDKKFSVLSDGERQLVMIGRAFVQDTEIILLDEPTAFLDVVNRKKIIETLARVSKEKKKLVIFSSHNLELVQQFCDGILIINNNQLSMVDSGGNELLIREELDKIFENEI